MDSSPAAFACAILAVLLTVCVVRWRTDPLYSIPTLGGPSFPGMSLLTTLNFIRNSMDIVNEGYQKFYGTAFKIAYFDRWIVVVSGSKMVDELKSRPDEELNFTEGVQELLLFKYTIGRDAVDDAYHIPIIKEKLVRTLPAILPDVIDELKLAVHEYIPTKGDEWVSLNALKAMQQIVARASNRAFVGVPTCRDQKYLDLSIRFALDAMFDRCFVSMVPSALRPLVGYLTSGARRTITRTLPHLQPIIDERKLKMRELGEEWDDKPNDMLQGIIDEATLRKASDLSIAERILITNVASIHTSSSTIAHTLYDLATFPEYIQPLRDEIEPIIAEEGWTKAAMAKMWKLDSFLKECQRYNGISLTAMTRKALKDITLHDGTFIPKGTLVAAAAHPAHHDETNYSNASTFDPFRFARLRASGEGEDTKHQAVNTSSDYLAFGHGKHACPGRFFAASEIKAILAYLLINYDLKLGGDGIRPPNYVFLLSVLPSMDGELLFRRRQVS